MTGPAPTDGPGPAPALELVGVSAAYGPYRALFDVSLAVPAGQVVALIGSNGAGKSTVARVASGLVAPSAGDVRVGGRSVLGEPAWRIARLGVAHVPEGRGVFADLTVEDNLRLALRSRTGRRQVDAALERVFGAFDILGRRRRQLAGTLSGGEQRILSLAAVLVEPPTLLVADELSLGLAPVVVDDVYQGLRQIHDAGTALLVVEQQIDRVLGLADQAVVLDRGSVTYDGPPDGALPAVEAVLAAKGERTALVGASAGPALGSPGPGDASPRGPSRWHRLGRRIRPAAGPVGPDDVPGPTDQPDPAPTSPT